MYTSLHNHDGKGSLLDSILKIDDFISFCKENNMDSIALTNHGTMHSYVEFQIKCLKNNIKPIHGCEVYLVDDFEECKNNRFHLILLAKNRKGIDNLFKMSKFAYDSFYRKPIIDLKTIKENNLGEGLICLSACLAGYVYRNREDENKVDTFIKECLDIFDYFALETQAHKTAEQIELANLCQYYSKKHNVPMVITTDSHYKEEQDIESHSTFVEIGTEREVGETYTDCYLQPYNRLKENALKLYDEEVFNKCVEETNKIKDMIEIYDIGIKQSYQMPKIEIPSKYNSNYEYFLDLIKEGIENKVLSDKQETIARVKREIPILKELDYIDYFLLLKDLVKLAKDNNIPIGYSRGSGANCMCLYLLGVTQVDSVRWELDFSRFANLGRKNSGMADFDLDISQNKRGLFIELVKQKYGKDFVIPIATFGTLSTKVAIRDIAKVLNKKKIYSLPYASIVKDVVALIPSIKTFNDIDGEIEKEELLKNVLNKIPKLREYYDLYPKWFEIVMKLEGLPRNLSKHASGVLMTPKPIYEYCPICLDSDKNMMCQLDMHDAMDEISLIKMDFLGLRNLDIVDEVLKDINKTWDDVDINTLDLDDKDVFREIYAKGNTTGIFQMESFECKRMAIECEVSSIYDVVALNALNRPGAKLSFPEYVKNKKEGTSSCHKDLMPIFKSTNYVLIYQEQTLKIFGLAGFDETERDVARRSIGKKCQEDMVKLEKKFKEGFKKLNWIETDINDLWKLVLKQSEYSFNLGHSQAYGLLSYLTAYLKFYYPAQYMKALLNSVKDNPQQMAKYMAECESMSIKVLPPNINKSNIDFRTDDNKILFGISAIKGIGEGFAEKVIENREYVSVRDFIEKNKPSSSQIVKLIKSGAFGRNKKVLLDKYEESLIESTEYTNDKVSDATLKKYKMTKEQYFKFKADSFYEKLKVKNEKIIENFNKKYRTNEILWEIESMNMFLTSNPFDGLPIENFNDVKEGLECTLAGAIIEIQNKKDKKGGKFIFFKLFTEFGVVECVAWSKYYSLYQNQLKNGSLVVLLTKKNEDLFDVKEVKDFFVWKKEKA